MTSVQRVLRYAELEPEPGYELTREPPAEWPKDGTLQFKETSLRYYNQGPRVLNKLCFTVKNGEKVGIVGRSGAGKSSLIAALMRMPEHEGDIFIDGATIKELNLTQSRSVVSVIPQNPFLFADTIRFNLDPEEKHSDLQLWHVLEKMQLKPLIEKSPNQLHCLVHENGSNFSLGERQMICLARAMLQKNKILIFDEATASIDLKTEKLIHEAVHTKFDNCTVLTIAHRLDTITDHDRVLVLDEGKVVEFDQPKVLLTINDGYFAKLHESYTTNQ